MPPLSRRLIPAAPLLATVLLIHSMSAGTGEAAEQPRLSLILQNHRFIPDHLTAPTGQRFLIELTNQDDVVAEFESYDMKFEKIVAGGGTVTVHAGPLHPGTYKFFDDYHPQATGSVAAEKAD